MKTTIVSASRPAATSSFITRPNVTSNRLTQAVSPLKVFEYLAMGVPVVATPMRELADLPYVLTAEAPDAFAALIPQAAALAVDAATIARFREANSWHARLGAMLGPLGLPVGPAVGS